MWADRNLGGGSSSLRALLLDGRRDEDAADAARADGVSAILRRADFRHLGRRHHRAVRVAGDAIGTRALQARSLRLRQLRSRLPQWGGSGDSDARRVRRDDGAAESADRVAALLVQLVQRRLDV